MSQYKKSEETKSIILQTASKLFYEMGYQATTVRDISAVSGVSLSRLNYHFHSKAEVAATVCKAFLKNINDQVYRTILPITNDLLLKDVIHIRLIAKGFISDDPRMQFYYEIACENIVAEILTQSSFLHFVEQSEYLSLGKRTEILRAYSHIFVAVLVEFMKSRHEGDPKLDEEQFLDLFSDMHLNLLDVAKDKRNELLQKAKEITKKMSFLMDDISSIKIVFTK
ncbi:MAG: TetR/AcrR family transcriptional regulator [Anaerofustis sp.]